MEQLCGILIATTKKIDLDVLETAKTSGQQPDFQPSTGKVGELKQYVFLGLQLYLCVPHFVTPRSDSGSAIHKHQQALSWHHLFNKVFSGFKKVYKTDVFHMKNN